MIIEICREIPRRKICSTTTDNLSNELCSVAHELNDKEKQLVLGGFWTKIMSNLGDNQLIHIMKITRFT